MPNASDFARDLNMRLADDLMNDGIEVSIMSHITSIYDYSILEAMSRVVQNQCKYYGLLEQMLDSLAASCKIDKAFLFDVTSNTFVATDSNHVDSVVYELISAMLEVVMDISCIYGQDSLLGVPQALDRQTQCTVSLSNGSILIMRQIDRHLALVCMVRDESYERTYLVDYNIRKYRDVLLEAFANVYENS